MENKEKKYKICGISTLPTSIKSFMIGNLQYVSEHGYESYCISSPGEVLNKEILGNVTYIPITEMKWGVMSPWAFYKCVKRLYKIFKKECFDCYIIIVVIWRADERLKNIFNCHDIGCVVVG